MYIRELTIFALAIFLGLAQQVHSNPTTPFSTAPSCNTQHTTLLGNRTCSCVKGRCCVDNTGNATCQCGDLYSGAKCEGVNLDLPVTCAVTPTSIAFTWRSLPDLNSVIFVYYFRQWHYHTFPVLNKRKINVLDDGKSIRLENLMSGGVAYVVCVLHNSTMVNMSSEPLPEGVFSERYPHCLSFRTKYDGKDPFTQAAIYVGIATVGIFFLVLGIYCGRMCSHSPGGRNSIRRIRKSIKYVTRTFDPAVARVRTSWTGVSRKLKRKSKWAKHPPTKREHRENGVFEDVWRPTSELCEKKSVIVGADVIRSANGAHVNGSSVNGDSVARNNQKRYISAGASRPRNNHDGQREVQLRNKDGIPGHMTHTILQNRDVLSVIQDNSPEISDALEEPSCKQVNVLSNTQSTCQVSPSTFPIDDDSGERGGERASIVHELDVILEEPCDS